MTRTNRRLRQRTLRRAIGVASVLLTACGGGARDIATIRLIDAFTADAVTGTPAGEANPEEVSWSFGGAPPEVEENAETRGWAAGPDVTGFALGNATLVGTSSGVFPVLHVERTQAVDDRDRLQAIEIRLRVSDGDNLWLDVTGGESVDLDDAPRTMQGSLTLMTTPLRAGETFETYTITPQQHVGMSAVRHLLLRPTDVEGATFAIEYVRVISRKEHLASVASGIGWQGFAEIYHEALVARSPEVLTFTLDLPDRPWLDLAVGTPEDGPVTFHIEARAGGDDVHLLERTVTTPYRWERQAIDLGQFQGQSVTMSLSLTAEHDGALGFWGSPVIRAPAGDTARNDRPRGVILVQADTLRSDHLDLYGYGRDTAPNLTALAGEGAVFRNTNAQATWTKVSTPSIMTSLYPLAHGVHGFNDRLSAAAVTLAERYREAGYATLGLSSVLFTGEFSNLHQGFEELHENGSREDTGPKTAREYVDRVAAWLERHRDVPFFIYLHVFDPHDPFEPFPPYNDLWADPARKQEHEAQLDEVREVIDDPLRRNFGMPNRAELEEVGLDADAFVAYEQGWYDGSIRGMDVEMGRLVERLRALGLDERTLIVFTSDHGEEFLDHGRMFHGQTVYGELTRVPLVMRWPGGISGGRVVDETTQLIDIMPTLMEISGLPPAEQAQGRSLVPLLRGEQAGAADGDGWVARPAFIEKALTSDTFSPPPRDTESYAVVDDGWKLIHNTVRPFGAPEFELYDANADPLDRTDVAAEHPDIVERLAREIDRWRRVAETARLPEDAESTEGMTPEQLERLRSLGYIR